jgi:lambda family phage portal protein
VARGKGRRKRHRNAAESTRAPAVPVVTVESLPVAGIAPARSRYFDGDKFYGGFGVTSILTADYWTLRARSSELFETNHYARGIIRRLVTNIINTGLHPEAMPEEEILGRPRDSLSTWTEMVENRFGIWQSDAWLCDHAEQNTFGALQALALSEAFVAGDVLVVLRQHPVTRLPRVQLIKGSCVQTPAGVVPRPGNRIVHGVELDAQGRHVAYWVRHEDGTAKRLPAYGEKSGRRLAWLLYATDRRLDDVRGKPVLALLLQSLKEIDRYRDATLRKAVINSMLAMFIKKGEERRSTTPMSGGAVRAGVVQAQVAGEERSFHVSEHIPGLVLDELQFGEEPQAFSAQGTVEEFGKFEEAVVQAFAWALQIPPEILTLSFSSNYSASQAAVNEFKMYLNLARTLCGATFCQPIYVEWLLAEVLNQKIAAPGLLEAWRDSTQYDVFAAWVSADWAGHIKPAVDMSKLVGGYEKLLALGLITRDRAARELTGLKFSKTVTQLARENELLAEALKPLTAIQPKPAPPPPPATSEEEPDEVDDDESEEEGDDQDAESARKAS